MSLRRIVATGGHSGLGLAALESLLQNPPASLPPPYHIILYARDKASNHVVEASNKLTQLLQALPGQSQLETRTMDLASISSVRTAANDLVTELETKDERLDVVLLNAAVAKATREMVQCQDPLLPDDILRDSQGKYEHTALVNHVSPLLFLNILRSRLISQPSLQVGSTQIPTRIVFTGSALHRKADLETLESAFSPVSPTFKDYFWSLRTTYAASKLLLTIGVQKFSDLLEDEMTKKKSQEKIEVVIVQPGFVPSTGLNRESSPSLKFIMSWIFPILPFSFITTLKDGGETIAASISKQLFTFPSSVPQNSEDSQQSESAASTSFFPAKGKWAPSHIEAKDGDVEGQVLVQRALIVRGRKLETPDSRTFDLDLQKRWWPKACDV